MVCRKTVICFFPTGGKFVFIYYRCPFGSFISICGSCSGFDSSYNCTPQNSGCSMSFSTCHHCQAPASEMASANMSKAFLCMIPLPAKDRFVFLSYHNTSRSAREAAFSDCRAERGCRCAGRGRRFSCRAVFCKKSVKPAKILLDRAFSMCYYSKLHYDRYTVLLCLKVSRFPCFGGGGGWCVNGTGWLKMCLVGRGETSEIISDAKASARSERDDA